MLVLIIILCQGVLPLAWGQTLDDVSSRLEALAKTIDGRVTESGDEVADLPELEDLKREVEGCLKRAKKAKNSALRTVVENADRWRKNTRLSQDLRVTSAQIVNVTIDFIINNQKTPGGRRRNTPGPR